MGSVDAVDGAGKSRPLSPPEKGAMARPRIRLKLQLDAHIHVLTLQARTYCCLSTALSWPILPRGRRGKNKAG